MDELNAAPQPLKESFPALSFMTEPDMDGIDGRSVIDLSY